MTEKIKIFISYSHNDTEIKRKLDEHLASLSRNCNAAVWADHMIIPGQEWAKEISEKLSLSNIILLLLTSGFIKSDYCYKTEMSEALEKHKAGMACVIPILAEDFYWQDQRLDFPFADLEMLPKDTSEGRLKPLSLWQPSDTGYAAITKGVADAMFSLQKNLGSIKNRNVDERRIRIESLVSENKLDDASSELMDFISLYCNHPETAAEPNVRKLRTNSIMLKGQCTAFRNNLEKELVNNPGKIMETLGILMNSILQLLEEVYTFLKRLFGIETPAEGKI